jgi:hypothetical protein
MKRRTVLRSILAMPAAVALPLPAQGQSAKPAGETPLTETSIPDGEAAPVATTFTALEFATLKRLAAMIVPAQSDTPGAIEAEAPEFLDFLIGASPLARKALYREGLERLHVAAHRKRGIDFAALDAADAESLLAPLRAPWTYRAPSDPFARFLVTLKDDLIQATVNSRPYIEAVSKRRRGAAGVGQYWYNIE